MTTITVVRKGNHVAIAADSLVKDGYTCIRSDYRVNDPKIVKYGDTYIATTGFGSWDIVLRRYFDQLESIPQLASADEIFTMLTGLHEYLKDHLYLNAHESEKSFETSRLTALYANSHGIFGSFSQRAVVEYSKFYSFGSGFKYSLGAMHAAYDQAPTDKAESALDIARIGISAAAEFDEDTDVPIESYLIPLANSDGANG